MKPKSTPAPTLQQLLALHPVQRGRACQTGSNHGTLHYRQPHPVFGSAIRFNHYRKLKDGAVSERWLLENLMHTRHQRTLAGSVRRQAAKREKKKPRQQKQNSKRAASSSSAKPPKLKAFTAGAQFQREKTRWELLASFTGEDPEQMMKEAGVVMKPTVMDIQRPA